MSTAPTTEVDTTALHWLALTLTPGLGPTRSRKLVEYFNGVERVFRASLTELEAAGMLAESAQSIFTGKSLELAHEELARIHEGKIRVLTLDHPAYPPQLKQIYDPPLLLYIRGAAELWESRSSCWSHCLGRRTVPGSVPRRNGR